jgi:hypothetical protein
LQTTIIGRSAGVAPRPATNQGRQGTAPASAMAHRVVVLPRARSDVFRREALRVAALSVTLAALLEVLQLGTLIVIGEPYGRAELIRDLILKVPWAAIVCVSFWMGLVLGRGRVSIAAFVLLVSAPLGSLFAHALAEMGRSYELSATHEMLISPYVVAALKGGAYVALAVLVVGLRARTRATAWHYAAAGLMIGISFGGALLALELVAAMHPITTSVLVAWAVNEVLFPIGCALILFGVPDPLLEVRTTPGDEGTEALSATPGTRGDGAELTAPSRRAR